MGFFDKIKKIGIFNGFSELTDDFYEELEESLVMADLGAETTMEAVEELKSRCKQEKIKDIEGARQCMRDILAEYLSIGDLSVDMSSTPRHRAVYRRQRGGQDHLHRQAGRPLEAGGPQGGAVRRGHLPGRRRRAAHHLGGPGRGGHRQAARGGRPRRRGL